MQIKQSDWFMGNETNTMGCKGNSYANTYGCNKFMNNYVGCAIGAHTGPGIIGIIFLNDESPYKKYLLRMHTICAKRVR